MGGMIEEKKKKRYYLLVTDTLSTYDALLYLRKKFHEVLFGREGIVEQHSFSKKKICMEKTHFFLIFETWKALNFIL